jgi:two-component system NtrC family sensor kinase
VKLSLPTKLSFYAVLVVNKLIFSLVLGLYQYGGHTLAFPELLVVPVVVSLADRGLLSTALTIAAAIGMVAYTGMDIAALVTVAVTGVLILLSKRSALTRERERSKVEETLRQDAAELEHMWNEQTRLSSELAESLNELAAAKRQIEDALAQLKVAQTVMVHSEKMASIGVLAAGVAHEINNPVGYIASNLRELKSYVIKIRQYLLCVEELELAVQEGRMQEAEEQRTELGIQKQLLKLNFILDDITDLVKDSLEGTSDIEAIVKSLKLYARKDDETTEQVDVTQCLENSLRIVWNQLKYNATVAKNYQAVRPIKGHSSQLQQVFSNLLVNAGQALATRGQITLEVVEENSHVVVRVSDDGCGIPPECLHRIFEPFFTTKDVGQGTGLGLSIAYDIVRKHGGSISAESQVGAGTTMTVRLPVCTLETSVSVMGEAQS